MESLALPKKHAQLSPAFPCWPLLIPAPAGSRALLGLLFLLTVPGGSLLLLLGALLGLHSFDDEPEYAARLLKYCQDHGYTISGDYICEVLTEFNVFDSQKRSMFLRLQVPLRFR